MPERRPFRDVDTRDALRAFGIMAVVANHSVAASLHGGLNLLLLLSGLAFARLAFGGQDAGHLGSATLRFVRPLALWSVILCLFWFAVFRRFEAAELLMVSNWITPERVSKFPIWYTQVLLQMLAAMLPVLVLTGMAGRIRQDPVRWTLAWLAAAVLVAALSKALFDTDPLADKLPQLHTWNFVLGWVFWAVLYARRPGTSDRVALTVLVLALMPFVFLGLGVEGGAARVWVAIPAALLLIWAPVLRLPRPLAHPLLLIAQAVLFIFFLHYPFLLAVRELLGDHLPPMALDALKVAAGLIGPVLVWAAVTAGRRTLAHARQRRRGAGQGAGGGLHGHRPALP